MIVRPVQAGDGPAVRALLKAAFGGPAEADLVEALVRDGDLVLATLAEEGDALVGYVAFSRLIVATGDARFPAFALAPLAVAPGRQRQGIGARLVEHAHQRLREAGEALSVVLGEPDYYRRFGYTTERAAELESPYPPQYLSALPFADAPRRGRLIYPRAFAGL